MLAFRASDPSSNLGGSIMPRYSVDIWGTRPEPENFQFNAEDEEEAEREAREASSFRVITNIEVDEINRPALSA
jgi:hypothetical protein